MTERGILMTPANYAAIHDNRKVQTRRIIEPQPVGEPRPLIEWSRGIAKACYDYDPDPDKLVEHVHRLQGKIFPFTTKPGGLMSPKCPYGMVGDRLYVKEAVRKSSLDRIAYKKGGPAHKAAFARACESVTKLIEARRPVETVAPEMPTHTKWWDD